MCHPWDCRRRRCVSSVSDSTLARQVKTSPYPVNSSHEIMLSPLISSLRNKFCRQNGKHNVGSPPNWAEVDERGKPLTLTSEVSPSTENSVRDKNPSWSASSCTNKFWEFCPAWPGHGQQHMKNDEHKNTKTTRDRYVAAVSTHPQPLVTLPAQRALPSLS